MSAKTNLSMTEIMPTEKANYAGNVHGGYILELLDRVSYACAARYCGHYVVTLSVDRVVFKKPIHVGELVHFHAGVNFVGNSSMEIGVKVVAEDVLTGEERHTNSCYFTMVAVDEDMKPVKIKPLELNTPKQKLRHAEAQLRRESAKNLNKEHLRNCEQIRKDLGFDEC